MNQNENSLRLGERADAAPMNLAPHANPPPAQTVEKARFTPRRPLVRVAEHGTPGETALPRRSLKFEIACNIKSEPPDPAPVLTAKTTTAGTPNGPRQLWFIVSFSLFDYGQRL